MRQVNVHGQRRVGEWRVERKVRSGWLKVIEIICGNGIDCTPVVEVAVAHRASERSGRVYRGEVREMRHVGCSRRTYVPEKLQGPEQSRPTFVS